MLIPRHRGASDSDPRGFAVTVGLKRLTNGPLDELLGEAASSLGVRAGFVRGLGFVRDARIRVGESEVTVTNATVVALNATVHTGDSTLVRATATLSYSYGGVPVVVAGEVIAADVESLECWIDGAPSPARAPDDAPPPQHAKPKAAAVEPAVQSTAPAKAERTATPKATRPNRPAPRASSPAEPKIAPKPKASPADWARVVAASQDLTEQDDGEIDVDELERGDVLLHPSLDACTILAVISDDAVKVRLPNGSVRKLVMRNFRLFAEGGGRFRVEKRAK